LGLCDIVHAHENAVFQTPMVELGQGPEACSSHTFPKILGRSMSNEVLLLCRKITAQEAYDFNFISRIIKKNENAEELMKTIVNKLAEMPLDCLVDAKRLLNDDKEIKLMVELNHKECENLRQKWSSPDLMLHLMKFFHGRKPNL